MPQTMIAELTDTDKVGFENHDGDCIYWLKKILPVWMM